ncbi:MAG: hypothetical protein Kilf2KO_22440 [Rhodospirillales bacterium]
MKTAVALVLAGSLALAACAPSIDSGTYTLDDAGYAGKAETAQVITVRAVEVENEGLGGGAAGAALGGAAGAMAGRGGDVFFGVLGALGGVILGAIVGQQVDKAINEQDGFEYVIQMEDGRLLTIVQGDEQPLQAGQDVLLIKSDRARIVPVGPNALDANAPAPLGVDEVEVEEEVVVEAS